MTALTDLNDIKAARSALPEYIRRTPIIPLARESAEIGSERCFLKCENLQVTGAYKVRAAFTVLNSLPEAARSKGIVLSSSGNFAQAFAYAGRMMGVYPLPLSCWIKRARTKSRQRKATAVRSIFAARRLPHANPLSNNSPSIAA